MSSLAGIDIGGTKTAVSLAVTGDGGIHFLERRMFATGPDPEKTIQEAIMYLDEILAQTGVARPDAIGVSCGGPLDSQRGLVLSPPNLPGWDRIDVVNPFEKRYGSPAGLQNDANAGALAEWRWGAGQGCQNMVFLTFGTGLGAGLILDGRLYAGKQDLAGEVGHIRLTPSGPVGYGKAGSFEGFCSGGGIARLAASRIEERIRLGMPPGSLADRHGITQIEARDVAEAARAGDPLAREIFDEVGRQLGMGLAALVDILNPERIVIGGIFARQRELIEPAMLAAMRSEALPQALSACQVLPAGLGEQIGDYAAAAIALQVLNRRQRRPNLKSRAGLREHSNKLDRGNRHGLYP